ncbi:hypothetical protein DSO57_1015375 [Entomophthora muscae]|nr:hypothetical protein DSO57_1015375 [Entomophthora muscae]
MLLHASTLSQRVSRVLLEGDTPLQPSDKVTSNMFRVTDFQCNVTAGEDVCAKIRTSYASATARLSMILDLVKPIDLQVVWKDMCPAETSCSRSTLGQASPSAFWAVDNLTVPDDAPKLDTKYMYPQSVVKQYTTNFNFLPFDIIIEHDSRQRKRMWFKGDEAIGEEQYEFEYLVLHELVHGLGFLSSFDQQLERNKEALLPPLKINPSTGIVEGIKRPFIFDKYLAYGFVPEASVDNWVQIMTEVSFRLKGLNRAAWEIAFLNSTGGRLAKELFNVATSPQSLFFLIGVPGSSQPTKLVARNDSPVGLIEDESTGIKSIGDQQDENQISRTKITLHTPLQFIPGSSISHLDLLLYQDTADFLMRPVASYGQMLYSENMTTNASKSSNDTSPPVGLIKGSFGPALVNVIKCLGYKVRTNLTRPTDSKPQDLAIQTSSAPIPTSLILGYMSLLSLLFI